MISSPERNRFFGRYLHSAMGSNPTGSTSRYTYGTFLFGSCFHFNFLKSLTYARDYSEIGIDEEVRISAM
jgi:hypothetical protein